MIDLITTTEPVAPKYGQMYCRLNADSTLDLFMYSNRWRQVNTGSTFRGFPVRDYWRLPEIGITGQIINLVLNTEHLITFNTHCYVWNLKWIRLIERKAGLLIHNDHEIFCNKPKELGIFPTDYTFEQGISQLEYYTSQLDNSEDTIFKLDKFPNFWYQTKGVLVDVSVLIKTVFSSLETNDDKNQRPRS